MIIPPLAPEVIFYIGSFPVTNALINGWIAVLFFLVVGLAFRGSSLIPKGFQNAVEGMIEFLLAEVRKVTGDEERARLFLPVLSSLFLFILFSNWLGLIPGTGTVGIYGLHDGHVALLPLLRPAASDLNLTLAIAAFAVLTTHFYALSHLGFADHFSKFFNIRGIFRALRKGPIAVIVALVEFGIGIIEMISELAKVVSLSLRLFGNIFAGEVLLTVMIGLFAFFVPIPFMLLEILVGVVQATVFSLLTLAYLTVSTQPHDEHDEHDEKHHEEESAYVINELPNASSHT